MSIRYTNYFLDTEFVEDGETIMPISLALVGEDGRELYFEMEFDQAKAIAHDFVRKNVLPKLRCKERLTREQARDAILEFVGGPPHPSESKSPPLFWAYYASYDWIILSQIFGTMMDLPHHFPKHSMDLQQWWVQLGRPDGVKPPDPEDEHYALADARWNLEFYRRLGNFEARKGEEG